MQSKSAAPPVSGSRPLRPFSTSELAAREVLRRQPGLQVLVGCVRRMTGDDVPPSHVPPRARHKSPFFVLYHPELKTVSVCAQLLPLLEPLSKVLYGIT